MDPDQRLTEGRRPLTVSRRRDGAALTGHQYQDQRLFLFCFSSEVPSSAVEMVNHAESAVLDSAAALGVVDTAFSADQGAKLLQRSRADYQDEGTMTMPVAV